jgi:hypothetical protein
VTETDDLARALDVAAARWPTLTRAQILVQLALEGSRATEQLHDDRRRRRLTALSEHRGMLTGVYETDYLNRLREDWPG